MASIDEHCRDCLASLGNEYKEVNAWLDEYAPTMGLHHRVMRHHKEGVEEARKIWGDDAAKAAEIHIMKDCYGEIPTKEKAELWDMMT
jgi:hypothetical protein